MDAPQIMYQAFDRFNERFFDGRIGKTSIEITKLGPAVIARAGRSGFFGYPIRLSDSHFEGGTRYDFANLMHEMVHMDVDMSGHGKRWHADMMRAGLEGYVWDKRRGFANHRIIPGGPFDVLCGEILGEATDYTAAPMGDFDMPEQELPDYSGVVEETRAEGAFALERFYAARRRREAEDGETHQRNLRAVVQAGENLKRTEAERGELEREAQVLRHVQNLMCEAVIGSDRIRQNMRDQSDAGIAARARHFEEVESRVADRHEAYGDAILQVMAQPPVPMRRLRGGYTPPKENTPHRLYDWGSAAASPTRERKNSIACEPRFGAAKLLFAAKTGR